MNNIVKFSSILMATTALGFCSTSGGVDEATKEPKSPRHFEQAASVLTDIMDDFEIIDDERLTRVTDTQQRVVDGIVMLPTALVDERVTLEVRGLVTAVGAMTEEFTKIHSEIKQGRGLVDRLTREKSELEGALRGETIARATAQGKLDVLAVQLIELRAHLDRKETERLNALEERNFALRERDTALVSITHLNDRIREKTEQYDAVQAIVNARLAELGAAHTGIAHLNDQLRDVRAQLDRRTIERDTALGERNDARALIEGFIAEQNAARDRIADLTTQLNAAHGFLGVCTGERDGFKAERDAANVLVVALTGERDGFKAERDKACTHVEDLRTKLAGITMELASKVSALAERGREKEDLKKRFTTETKRQQQLIASLTRGIQGAKSYLSGTSCPAWTPQQNIAGALKVLA